MRRFLIRQKVNPTPRGTLELENLPLNFVAPAVDVNIKFDPLGNLLVGYEEFSNLNFEKEESIREFLANTPRLE